MEQKMPGGGKDRMALVYCPCPSLDEAKRLGHGLLDEKLAGCINILPGMASLYDWQGAREEAQEAVLIAKSSRDKASEIGAWLQRNHPYEAPAVLVIVLADINAGYRDWLLERLT